MILFMLTSRYNSGGVFFILSRDISDEREFKAVKLQIIQTKHYKSKLSLATMLSMPFNPTTKTKKKTVSEMFHVLIVFFISNFTACCVKLCISCVVLSCCVSVKPNHD